MYKDNRMYVMMLIETFNSLSKHSKLDGKHHRLTKMYRRKLKSLAKYIMFKMPLYTIRHYIIQLVSRLKSLHKEVSPWHTH